MTTLHGKEIKVGDNVWDVRKGWQSVINIGGATTIYPISLGDNAYTDTGRLYLSDPNPTLFWEEMILTPKPEPVYEWQWLYWFEDKYVTSDYYKSHEDIMKDAHDDCKSRPLIRIEESKREVKP